MIDLQSHTTSSDGELEPEELIDLAVGMKLSAIAITDHDSVSAIARAIFHAKIKHIEVVPGVELSCDDSILHYEKIDVLGLFIDPENRQLVKLVEHINDKREENKKKIINKLKELGYNIEYEDVKKTVKGTFGRPHIAKYLLKKYPDKFKSVRDVFDQEIGAGKPAFFETNDRVSIKDAIQIIKGADGIAILAHPGIYTREESLKLIDYFIGLGGDGIETYYPYHIICPEYKIDKKGNEEMISFYKSVARQKKILESGGNDHHGNYRFTLGEVQIPDSVLDRLRQRMPVT